MKIALHDFQQTAVSDLHTKVFTSLYMHKFMKNNAIITFTAPTGSGKTVMITSLLERIYFGEGSFPPIFPPINNAVIVWLSGSPELNNQSKEKMEIQSDKFNLNKYEIIDDSSFNKEILEDGKIYFLNTQKIGNKGNLTKISDNRQYTIWETMRNTAEQKADRFIFIIDEAHIGASDKNLTIMKKFIMGSKDDNLPPMPLIIGMTATPVKFEKMLKESLKGIEPKPKCEKVEVKPVDLKGAGLLKDRIIINYPKDDKSQDIAILQAAANEWMDKCRHWHDYCSKQPCVQVNPIFIVQVENSSRKGEISKTNLDDCFEQIEKAYGMPFKPGEVVHAFGEHENIKLGNGYIVQYEEPSKINNNASIKVVFFKDSLSTGWDCPRAEAMMSFRTANDETNIAQLLGRMIRTPRHKRIIADESLNEVRLFLPRFNKDTVSDIVKQLETSEIGSFPGDAVEIGCELTGDKPLYYSSSLEEFNALERMFSEENDKMFDSYGVAGSDTSVNGAPSVINSNFENYHTSPGIDASTGNSPNEVRKQFNDYAQTSKENMCKVNVKPDAEPFELDGGYIPEKPGFSEYQKSMYLEREEQRQRFEEMRQTKEKKEKVRDYINGLKLTTYRKKRIRKVSALKSWFRMARFLSETGLKKDAISEAKEFAAQKIDNFVAGLKKNNKYEKLKKDVKEFQLLTSIFPVFKQIDEQANIQGDLFKTLIAEDRDIDVQFNGCEKQLGDEGIGLYYVDTRCHGDYSSDYKIDVIGFVTREDCIGELEAKADGYFKKLSDSYYLQAMRLKNEERKSEYLTICNEGSFDCPFELPSEIIDPNPSSDYLFINGLNKEQKLNTWEKDVLNEERSRGGYLYWFRNEKDNNGLGMSYWSDGDIHGFYPDFLIIRIDESGNYLLSILEPHRPDYKDNVPKAQALAKYFKEYLQKGFFDRMQIIRFGYDKDDNQGYLRLDMRMMEVREKVLNAYTSEDLDKIFKQFGFIENALA